MKIELHNIPIRDLFDNFNEDEENGIVTGYHGQLNMRPVYQREFIYDDNQKRAVIKSIRNNFPLNVMYWVKVADGSYELLDGQQRSIAICQYVDGTYSVDEKAFHSLKREEREQILDYKLMIYICEGTDQEVLDWFTVINIAGKPLKDQEIRNAIYHGPWVSSARKYFSKRNCPGYQRGADYIKCEWERQLGLETVLNWIIDKENRNNPPEQYTIRSYMSFHQFDEDAKALWEYYGKVMDWVQAVFPKYRSIMKGLPWGLYYNEYGETYTAADADNFEKKIQEVIKYKDELGRVQGVYEYVMDGEEKHLNPRTFNATEKAIAYEKQKGICPYCKKHFEIDEMQADHIKPWSKGGKTTQENCQMLCTQCNGTKSNK